MYVTRPLSLYRKFPSSLATPPPEGPNSGILVIQDEEAEETCCFGSCNSYAISALPFPQNKKLTVRYSTGAGENKHVSRNEVVFIPVLDQPLSSNRYHAIQPRGRHKGEAFTSSTKEDGVTCCGCFCVVDVELEEPVHHALNQQFEIQPNGRRDGYFTAKSVAPDGYPPYFLRRKGWSIKTSTPRNFMLDEALGLDSALRVKLPEFNFPVSSKSSNVVTIGRWYCPFMFVKDGKLKDQIKKSMYYEMTLEQRWEQVFASENSYSEGSVVVDVEIEKEGVVVGGRRVLVGEMKVVDGVMWYGNFSSAEEVGAFGLSMAVFDRMKWEMQRFGWVDEGNKREVRIKMVEENGGGRAWRKFGCYVLVERFVLKRMDGSLVLTHDFKHTHHVRSKWE